MCRVVLGCLVDSGLQGRGWVDSKHARVVSLDRDVQVPRYVVRLGMRMSAGAAHAPEAVLRLRSASEACQKHAFPPQRLVLAVEKLQMGSASCLSVRGRCWSICKRTASHDLAAAARARGRGHGVRIPVYVCVLVCAHGADAGCGARRLRAHRAPPATVGAPAFTVSHAARL